jgi:hypothetical protein
MLNSRALMAAVAICTIGGVAHAGSGSPHFVTGPTASIDSTTGDLVVNWKEAGLGNTPIEYDLVVQTVEFTWQCFTKSGNKPQGSPNSGGESQAFTSTTITPHNGNITGTLALGPQLPPPNVACQGKGLKLCLTAVSYTGVMFEDETDELVAIGTENEQTEGSAGGPTLTHSDASGFGCS